MKEPRLIAVGKIGRTHGVRGAVKVYPYGETLAGLDAGDELFLSPESGCGKKLLTIEDLRSQGKAWVARFSELSSMDEAERLVGEEVFLPEDFLPPPEEGEYYHYQLIGLAVETREGRFVGTLRGIIETAGNDVYTVEFEGREVLIPAVEEIILEVDLERKRVVIDPPEGLLE